MSTLDTLSDIQMMFHRILNNPDDLFLRKVYADKLIDNGRQEEGEFILEHINLCNSNIVGRLL